MSTDKAERSSPKEFLAVATIKGDLSNITAPPFVLATQSTTEFPSYWAEHPALFLAPASEPDPAARALSVLRWYLSSLRNPQYGGRDEKDGVKKPLNAFLGELFIAHGRDGTELIAEQVSHYPPVTACYLYNEKAGISAEGFACQEISFNGSVHVKQIGHAVVRLDKYNESYLIPLPNVKNQGGFVSEIDFSGKGFLSGKKNSLDAILYKQEPAGDKKHPLFTITGQWNDLQSTPMQPDSLNQQDAWESRKAWAGVINALNAGDMKATVAEKLKVEEAQRSMRKIEEEKSIEWKPLFFSQLRDRDPLIEDLAAEPMKEGLFSERSGMLKFNSRVLKDSVKRPFVVT